MASVLAKLEPLYRYFPEVKGPSRHVSFKEKLLWSGIVLMLFFIMGQIVPLGASTEKAPQLETLQIIFASELGTLMSIGIGPIVTASIILQLLVGAKIVNLDLTKQEDKAIFQGTQKLLVIILALFEAFAFAKVGAIPLVDTSLGTVIFVTLQVAFASVLLMFFDELISKWGIGSGIGLFIAAGVSQQIITQAFNIIPGKFGAVPSFLDLLAAGQLNLAILYPLVMTIVVFIGASYFECLKIEIPLSYGRFGIGTRYPLKFFYTSNIPVILASAVLANVTIFASIFAGAGLPLLGQVDSQNRIIETMEQGGLGFLITRGNLYGVLSPSGIHRLGATETFFDERTDITCGSNSTLMPDKKACIDEATGATVAVCSTGRIRAKYSADSVGSFYYCSVGGVDLPSTIIHLIVYLLVFILLCVLFGVFWVMMSGMDAQTVSQQMETAGLQIPGFRADSRVIQRVLERYIPQLTVVSSVAVGLLAVVADLTGALGSGTGILLTVGIVYRMYEEIKREQMAELSPALRRFMGG